MLLQSIKEKIREVPDFPKKGILFYDITTALHDAQTLRKMIDGLCDEFRNEKIDYIVGVESRGFIFGMPMAYSLGVGFIPVRKQNKLPADTFKESYDLEYGQGTLEIHKDALKKGNRVLIVDDLLATGGTAVAACKLAQKTGADVIACAFLIELDGLGGREKIEQFSKTFSMLKY